MAPSFEEWIPRIDEDVFIIPPRLRNDESDFGLEPAQRRPFFGLELAADHLKMQDRDVDGDNDLVATAKEIANQYVPGEAEQAVFAAAIASSSSSSSGNASGVSVVARRSMRRTDALHSLWYQLPVGVFVFRNEYNTERHRHGDVYFTDDVKASDLFTLDDKNPHPRPAAEWQTKVEFLLIAKDFADDRNTFVPAPQAAYATGVNHSKSGPKISQVVTGSRTMRFEKIDSKDDAARFIWRATILMQCKMPGLRVVKEVQTAKHAKCHATVEVRIDGHDAEFMKVVVKDACVHRAAQIPKDAFPASEAAIGLTFAKTPCPEPFAHNYKIALEKRVNKIMELTAKISGKKFKNQDAHATLMRDTPADELLRGNFSKCGGTIPDNLQTALTRVQKPGLIGPPMDGTRMKALQHITAVIDEQDESKKPEFTSRAGCIQVCDVLSLKHCRVVFFDDARVKVTFAHSTYEGIDNINDVRGLVFDFALKFTHRTDTHGKQIRLWTLIAGLPHPFYPGGTKSASVLRVLEATMSKADSIETHSVLAEFKSALSRTNKNVPVTVPLIITDVSATLALAASITFNGCTFNEMIARIEERLEIYCSDAEKVRKKYADVIGRLRAHGGHETPESAWDAVSAASQLFAPASKSVPVFTPNDVLCYQPVNTTTTHANGPDDVQERPPQMFLQLTETAKDNLQRCLDTAQNVDDDLRAQVHELLATSNATFECFSEMTCHTHCRPHKIRAAMRTCKIGSGFRKLTGDGERDWAAYVTKSLIVTPFGERDLHNVNTPSPFVGPKDYAAAKTFYSVINDVLRTRYIPCDASEWPEEWNSVLRFREISANEAAREGVYSHVLEIFAGARRVCHARVRSATRIVKGEKLLNDTTLARDVVQAPVPVQQAESQRETPRATSDQERSSEIEAATDYDFCLDLDDDDETDDAKHEDKMAMEFLAEEGEEMATARLTDENQLARHMLAPTEFDGVEVLEDTEGDIVTMTPANEYNLEIVSGSSYVVSPFFIETKRGGTSKRKNESIYPVWSMVSYAARLFTTTGPLVRGLFYSAESTSSHVESVFKNMRSETKGNLELADYIRLKVSRASGSPSLMDTDLTSFSAGANESNRQVRPRAKKPPSEKHKDDPSGLKCGKYMANSQKNCTANITTKGQQTCKYKRCGHHCENKSECPVHRSSGKK